MVGVCIVPSIATPSRALIPASGNCPHSSRASVGKSALLLELPRDLPACGLPLSSTGGPYVRSHHRNQRAAAAQEDVRAQGSFHRRARGGCHTRDRDPPAARDEHDAGDSDHDGVRRVGATPPPPPPPPPPAPAARPVEAKAAVHAATAPQNPLAAPIEAPAEIAPEISRVATNGRRRRRRGRRRRRRRGRHCRRHSGRSRSATAPSPAACAGATRAGARRRPDHDARARQASGADLSRDRGLRATDGHRDPRSHRRHRRLRRVSQGAAVPAPVPRSRVRRRAQAVAVFAAHAQRHQHAVRGDRHVQLQRDPHSARRSS